MKHKEWLWEGVGSQIWHSLSHGFPIARSKISGMFLY